MMKVRYRPLLKAKQGEFGALATLHAKLRDITTPILEPLPEHAADVLKFVRAMKKSWPAGTPFMLDFRLSGDPAAMRNASDRLHDAGLVAIPVVGNTQAEEYIQANADAATRHDAGSAIRLAAEDIGDLEALPAVLELMVRRLRRDPHEVDILIDLYAFTAAQVGAMTTASVAAVRSFPRVAEWRSITLLGTSFPENLSGLNSDSVTKVTRAEWEVWRRATSRTLPRAVDFGDYGIAHPELPHIDPRFMTMSANLRYTIADSWLVFKGRGVNKHGYAQFNAICKKLVQMPEYSGPEFSWGDAEIQAHCRTGSSSGNASTWRQIGTSHHITFVARDLASRHGS